MTIFEWVCSVSPWWEAACNCARTSGILFHVWRCACCSEIRSWKAKTSGLPRAALLPSGPECKSRPGLGCVLLSSEGKCNSLLYAAGFPSLSSAKPLFIVPYRSSAPASQALLQWMFLENPEHPGTVEKAERRVNCTQLRSALCWTGCLVVVGLWCVCFHQETPHPAAVWIAGGKPLIHSQNLPDLVEWPSPKGLPPQLSNGFSKPPVSQRQPSPMSCVVKLILLFFMAIKDFKKSFL